MIIAPEVKHFLDDLALLVHLDRVDTAVTALIAVLTNGKVKGLVQLAQPMFDDVGEADQNRQGDAAPLECVDQLFQIDAAGGFFGWMNKKVAILSYGEIALAPARYVIEFGSVGGGPAIGGFAYLRSNGCNFCGQRNAPLEGLALRGTLENGRS